MDLAPYFARLALLLPLLCSVIVGGLWLAKTYLRVGVGGEGRPASASARVTQTLLFGAGARLAVVEFADRRLLLALGKGGITTIAEAPLATTVAAAPAIATPVDSPLPPFGVAFATATKSGSIPFAAIRAAASRFGRAANAR